MTEQSQYPHLKPTALEQIDKSIDERIEFIRSPHWIGYPTAKDVISQLEDLLRYPSRHRMPNLLVIGETNSGKTMLANRFEHLHPGYEADDGESIVIPVLKINAPPVPSESRLYSNILEKLFAPYRSSDSNEKKYYQVIKLCRACNVQMLVIDEIHSILAGNLEKQRTFLSVLRNIANELKIPIVAFGIKDALRAIKTDPQLDNRFKKLSLPRWDYGNEYRSLLKTFEQRLPLKQESKLASKSTAMKILTMSEGLLGETADILIEAAVAAIVDGREKIDVELLSGLGWDSPSVRRSRNS